MEEMLFIIASPYPFKTSQETTWRQRWFNGMNAVIQIESSLKVATGSSGSFLTAVQLHRSQRTSLPPNRLSVKQPEASQLKPLSSHWRYPHPPEHADQPSETGRREAEQWATVAERATVLMGQGGRMSTTILRGLAAEDRETPWFVMAWLRWRHHNTFPLSPNIFDSTVLWLNDKGVLEKSTHVATRARPWLWWRTHTSA